MLAGIIGLGGFDLLNGYAATSWLTMLEVVVVASVLTAVYKGMHYQDSKKNGNYCWNYENFYYLLCLNCRSFNGRN